MSLAYSSVYGNKIRKLWKLLAKNDMLTSTSYEFSNPNNCKVKDCNFKVISYHVVKNFYCYSMFLFTTGQDCYGDFPTYPGKPFDRNQAIENKNWSASSLVSSEAIPKTWPQVQNQTWLRACGCSGSWDLCRYGRVWWSHDDGHWQRGGGDGLRERHQQHPASLPGIRGWNGSDQCWRRGYNFFLKYLKTNEYFQLTHLFSKLQCITKSILFSMVLLNSIRNIVFLPASFQHDLNLNSIFMICYIEFHSNVILLLIYLYVSLVP